MKYTQIYEINLILLRITNTIGSTILFGNELINFELAGKF